MPMSPPRCYCASARHLARRLTRFYDAELRPAGMNPAQFELLATIHGGPGRSQSELAAALDLDQTTLSRNLKLLTAQGWLAPATAAEDRRRMEYVLTPPGRAALREAMPHWERAHAHMEQALASTRVWPLLDRLSQAAELNAG